MKKVLFVLLSLLIMAVAVSCDSSATVSADAVLDLSKVEAKAGDKVVIDVTCGSKTMPSQGFTIDDPSQKAPKYKINVVRKSSGIIKVKVYRQNGLLTKSDTEESLVAAGSTEVEDFSEQGTYTVTVYEVYSITYDANGATSGTAPAAQNELVLGEDVIIANNTGRMEKSGVVFVGWNTKADGSGTRYDAESTVTGGFTGDTTLYAEWKSGSYAWFGGNIFYVHDDNGAKYTFYDTNLKVIPKQDVSSLYYGGATYYVMEGTPSADKFYVYNNDIYCGPGKDWGNQTASYPENSTYKTGDVYKYGIGWGKTLTKVYCIDENGKKYSGTIWEWLDDGVNGQKLAGYSDWYIPCAAELDKLKASGMKQDWCSSGKKIWTSVEYDWLGYAWVLTGDGSYDNYCKSCNSDICTVAIRSF